jgi:hypothetical protein
MVDHSSKEAQFTVVTWIVGRPMDMSYRILSLRRVVCWAVVALLSLNGCIGDDMHLCGYITNRSSRAIRVRAETPEVGGGYYIGQESDIPPGSRSEILDSCRSAVDGVKVIVFDAKTGQALMKYSVTERDVTSSTDYNVVYPAEPAQNRWDFERKLPRE